MICIRRQWNYCSTTYSNEVEDGEYIFQLVNLDSGENKFFLNLLKFIKKNLSKLSSEFKLFFILEGTSVIPEKQAGVEIFSCNDDYISVNSIRLCGEKLNDASRIDDLTLNALITDTTNGLNFIPVRTSQATVGRGFRINYMQIPCEDQPVTMEPIAETTESPTTEESPPISKYKRTFN